MFGKKAYICDILDSTFIKMGHTEIKISQG